MRSFTTGDGKGWSVRVVDGSVGEAAGGTVGWEALLFECQSGEVAERLAYRPVGWLTGASAAELEQALHEAGLVRASWRA